MKISKRAQYGVRAMVSLANNYKSKKFLSINKISQIEGVPFGFLEKIVSQLEKAKLVESKKGSAGGYALAKTPKKINVNDIVSILENQPKEMVNCSSCYRNRNCVAKNVWSKVELSMSKALKSITLASLIKN